MTQADPSQSRQRPLGAAFGASSTAREVIGSTDLSGKTAIVTGGYSGLGLETARILAGAGARVIVPARAPDRARSALAAVPGAQLEQLDLMDPASIDGFAQRFLDSGLSLDLLVGSAGIMAIPLARDAHGNEAQFSTNHLGHFRLAVRLWPALQRANAARVVSFSSAGHHIAGVDFDDVNFERRHYDKWVAYGQSKTANILFSVALDAWGAADGIRAYSLHPGTVLGPLARHLSAEEIATFDVHDADGAVIVDPSRDLKSVEQGAATAIWCATSPMLDSLGGVYCENCDVAPITTPGDGIPLGVRRYAIDPTEAERLWQYSERVTGVGLS